MTRDRFFRLHTNIFVPALLAGVLCLLLGCASAATPLPPTQASAYIGSADDSSPRPRLRLRRQADRQAKFGLQCGRTRMPKNFTSS